MADLPAVIPLQHRHYTLTYLLAAAVVGLVLGVLITWAFFTDAPSNAKTSNLQIPNLDLSGTTTTSGSGQGVITVHDQPAGMQVVVVRADISEGQWIVIHEEQSGALSNVLGAARFVGGATTGTVELLRATMSGVRYHAVIYADNGDAVFSLEDDTPLRDASNALKESTFKAQ